MELDLILYSELRPFSAQERRHVLQDARKVPFDLVELLGMAAAVVLVTSVTRYGVRSDFFEQFSMGLVNFLVAIPLLAVMVGPFLYRRTRRGLRKALEQHPGRAPEAEEARARVADWKRQARHAISALFTLYGFWLLLSGYFTVFLMAAGLACVLAVVWFAHRMDVIDREGHPIHLGWRVLAYWLWLIKEIVKSGWQVSRIILSPALPVSPTLVRVTPTQSTDVGLVVHANSITLTPGTITLEARADGFVVHALTGDGGVDLARGAIDRRVTALEGTR